MAEFRFVVESGLSPRVRGSRLARERHGRVDGSIPACAGEPPRSGTSWAGGWVYPRVCGGAASLGNVMGGWMGLSPRVRGSRLARERHGRVDGSIPACAGEPPRSGTSWAGGWVYPRVCGGAQGPAALARCPRGLSPRVRGSPRHRPAGQHAIGSIPACAGEPPSKTASAHTRRVYPRVCGGASLLDMCAVDPLGLSPRVRGSRLRGIGHPQRLGSIPACAGEPCSAIISLPSTRVYPRVCGGAPSAKKSSAFRKGLSPRVRGSRPRGARACSRLGSHYNILKHSGVLEFYNLSLSLSKTPTARSPRESPRRPPRRCGTRSQTARAAATGH